MPCYGFARFCCGLNSKLISDEDFSAPSKAHFVIDFVRRLIELVLHLVENKAKYRINTMLHIQDNRESKL